METTDEKTQIDEAKRLELVDAYNEAQVGLHRFNLALAVERLRRRLPPKAEIDLDGAAK